MRRKTIDYRPEPFNTVRPSYLLAADLLRRIAHRNGIQFGQESHADVMQLIDQLRDEIEEAAKGDEMNRQEQEARSTVALDSDTRRACNNRACLEDFGHVETCSDGTYEGQEMLIAQVLKLERKANYVERLVVTVEQQARKIHNDGQVIGRTTFEECVAADCVEAKKFLAEIEEAAKGDGNAQR